MNRYEYVQQIKKHFRYEGINFGRVFSLYLYNNTFIYFIKILFDSLVLSHKVIYNKSGSNILVEYSPQLYKRKDYNDIVTKFKSALPNYDEVFIKRNFNVSKMFKRLILLFKFYNLVSKEKDLSVFWLEKIKLAALLTKYNDINGQLLKVIDFSNYKILTTFCDIRGISNLLAQICNNKEIVTVTLQHGQYRYLKEGKETPDIEVYKNFISDYLLCWGQATVDEFLKAGIERERLLKVGALKQFSLNSTKINIVKREKGRKVFGVILNGETYKQSNDELLNIAEEFAQAMDFHYVIRLHPKNKISNYKKYMKSHRIKKILSKVEGKDYYELVDFSLLHMTGVYVELLAHRKPFFILNDQFTEDLFKYQPLMFKNSKELLNQTSKFFSDKELFEEKLRNRYKYFNEDGELKQNYINAIKKILNSPKPIWFKK
jgi:hypothetical protein